MVKVRHVPIRTCVSCGGRIPQSQLIRVWINIENALEIGLASISNRVGRGVYLCLDSRCWDPREYTRGLEKGLRIAVSCHMKTCLSNYYKENLDMPSEEAL